MNRRARLRPQQSGIIYYYNDPEPGVPLSAYDPDYTFTRLCMGIAPPEESTPGYCCIVGEKLEPDSAWDKSSFVLVDEATCLQPAFFFKEEQEKFGITAAAARYPTQEGLRAAAIALKDLYGPQLCWCVPVPHFINYLRRGMGLTWYDYERWHMWGHWFPFIKGPTGRKSLPKHPATVGIVGDGDDVLPENREYGLLELNSLFAEERFEIARYNHYDAEDGPTLVPSLFLERRDQWPAIYRALSWVTTNMRQTPVVYALV